MIIYELLYNLFALLSLSVISNFIDQKFDSKTIKGQISQGLLFGIIAVIGMSYPFVFSEGIIFDGRSIVISLATLFFGYISGLISSLFAVTYRIYLGGEGAFVGVLVILLSFLLGSYFYKKVAQNKIQLSNSNLYLFGLIVSSAMVLSMVFLPSERILNVMRRIGPTVIIFYPIITLGIGKIILNQLRNNETLISLKKSEELFKTTLYSIGDAVITTDKYGNVTKMNSIAEQLTGWKEKDAIGKPLDKVFVICNEYTRSTVTNPVKLAYEKGIITNLANHTLLISKTGKEYPIVDSAAPIKIREEIIGVVLIFRDQTEERKKIKALEEKEKFQSFLISNLPGFVYRCAYDKNWTMYYISDVCFEITGYKPQEFLTNSIVFNDIIDSDYKNEINQRWEKALRDKSYFEYEYPIKTKSGVIKWIWEKGRGILSDSGELLYLEGYITDITEKTNYYLQLKESEKKFRVISNLISDYLFSSQIDKEGKVSTNWVAGAFEKITGYSFEEYIQSNGLIAFSHTDDRDIVERFQQKLLNNQEATAEFRTFHKSGRIVCVRVFASPIWDTKEKRVTEILGAVKDITPEKKSELLSQIEVEIFKAVITHKSEIELYETVIQQISQLTDVKNFFIAYYNSETGLLRSFLETDEKDDIPVWKAKGSLTGYLIEQNKTICLKKSELDKLLDQKIIELVGTAPQQWLGVPLRVKDDVVGALVIQDYSNPDAFDEDTISLIERVAGTLSLFLERQRGLEEIRESEERFRNLFENQEAILLLLEAESGIVVDANKSAQKFYGYSLDELKEKTIFDIDTAPQEIIRNSMMKIFNKIQSKFEAKHRLANGEIRNVEIYISLITVKNNRFFYAIVFDKTEQKQAEKEIQLLKTAIIQNPAIIFIADTKGNIEFVNPKFTELTQYTLEEVKGKSTRLLKSGFHSEDFYKSIWSKINKGEDWRGEILNRKKDGSLFWVESLISPIIDEFGKITNFIAVQEDITQRKKILETLIKSEEEFRSVWENSVDAMRLVDENGIVINVNKAYCQLFKVKRENLIGKPFNIAYVIRDRNKTLNSFIQRFKYRTIIDKFETEIELLDGNLIWVELTNAFIEVKNFSALLLSIFRDITPYKKLINELTDAKNKAEEMNKVKSYFFANMSHELRTPLVGILGFADILKDELEDRPDLSHMAELITKSGQRLKETLNLILSLSKLEAGKIEIKMVEENIIPHIINSYKLFEQAAKKKGLNYNLELPDKEILCRIDSNLIQNILNNLINNAIKFTNKGSVTVKLETVGNNARIQIIDTGIGIPKESQNLIWEEFRQVSEGLNRSFEGTGLGLTIVKRFTTLLNGKIYLESEKDKGSNFIIEFPLVDKKLDKELKETNKIASKSGENLLTENKFDLLYVEDDQASVDIVSLMLRGKYDFDVARTADEALMKVKQNSYRAILMDINLQKDIDGVQLTKMIRQINNYSDIPIAAITAYAFDSNKEEFLSQGMTHYLSKPFSKNDLFDLLAKMLEE